VNLVVMEIIQEEVMVMVMLIQNHEIQMVDLEMELVQVHEIEMINNKKTGFVKSCFFII